MPVSPFAAPIEQQTPEQEAAALALDRRQNGPEAQIANGQNPVAAHLLMAAKMIVQRGAQAGRPLPEDMAALQQFFDFLRQLGGGAQQQQPAPLGQAAPPMGPLTMAPGVPPQG